MLQLSIQIVEIAEAAGEKEVLADIAIGSLDLALGLGPVGPAGPRLEAVVAGKIDQRAVVDDAARGLANDDRLHAVIENLARNAADCRERRHVTAQNPLHVLVPDEAPPDQAAEAEHQREQPDDACHGRFVGEYDLELGKIDLRLRAWRRFEANLEGGQWRRAELQQLIGDRGIAAPVAALAQLPP